MKREMISTLFPFEPTFSDNTRTWQGRSKKKLKPVIVNDGRVWVARHEGRPGRFFGPSKQEAENNLRVGAA